MSTDVTVLNEEKKKNWLGVAQRSQALDISLATKRDTLLKKLADAPKLATAEAISNYESVLKSVKQELSDLKTERLQFTNILEKVKTNKMQPENDVAASVAKFESALLTVKIEKKKNDDIAQAKIDEEKRLRETFANHIATSRAAFETDITNKVALAFEVAIKTKMEPEKIDAYLQENMDGFTEADFKLPKYQGSVAVIDKATAAAIMTEIWEKHKIDPLELIAQYRTALSTRFEFYSLSLKNADDALTLANAEHSKSLNAISEAATNQTIANKLETVAVSMPTGTEVKTKSIKTVYEIDMEDSEQSAIVIIAAFSANWALCKTKVRITIWDNLAVKQMKAALVAIKNADEKFEVSGIKWKTVDKL